MADTFIQLNTDGSGKKLDTRTESTNSEHRQVFVLGDPTSNSGVAPVDGTAGVKVDLGADNDVVVSTALPAGTNNIGDVDVVTLPVAFNTGTRSSTTQRVTIATDDLVPVSLPTGSLTATRSTVADTATSTTVLASNGSRLGAQFINNSSSTLYLKFGTTADLTTGNDVIIPPLGYYELQAWNNKVYTGRIDGIWASDASGSVNVVEFS